MSSGHAELPSAETSCLARVERGASQTAAELRRSGGPSLQDRVTGEKLEKEGNATHYHLQLSLRRAMRAP
jgi:hypothetical protein